MRIGSRFILRETPSVIYKIGNIEPFAGPHPAGQSPPQAAGVI
jgi:hypothetical protein